MAGQYSPLQFFRRTPNALLARYFHEKHGVLGELAFERFGETEVELIFEGFLGLPNEKQAQIEAECQDINAMACQGGVRALADEAAFHQDHAFPEEISKIDGLHGAAMWAFLEHPDYWTGATLFLQADIVSESFWKKRNDLPHVAPNVGDDDLELLARAVGEHFHSREGRGRKCKVEVFRRHEKDYFFAYPEDFARSGMEWVREELSPRSRHPAFEIIFVYSRGEGSLDIYAPRNTNAVPELQRIFAKIILRFDDLKDFGGDNRVYVLDALANRDFQFKYPVDYGITSVMVRLLRLSLKSGGKRRVTVQADPSNNAKAVYDLLDRLNVPPYHVTQALIKVTFAALPGARGTSRSFRISYPNWCALRHDGRDMLIRRMLIDSGIEPTEPTGEEEDGDE